MPFRTLEDLPGRVRRRLPRHAQGISRAPFNDAWDDYRGPQERRRAGRGRRRPRRGIVGG